MAGGQLGQFCNGHCRLEIQSSKAIPALIFSHPSHFGLSVFSDHSYWAQRRPKTITRQLTFKNIKQCRETNKVNIFEQTVCRKQVFKETKRKRIIIIMRSFKRIRFDCKKNNVFNYEGLWFFLANSQRLVSAAIHCTVSVHFNQIQHLIFNF